MGGSGYGMGGSGYGGYGGDGMGSGMGMGSGYGMGSGSGMGSGEGMGSTSGTGMDMDMDNMQWPERCRRRCIYKKRNSYDDRMYCFARSEYSQSMCLAGDYDGEKPIN